MNLIFLNLDELEDGIRDDLNLARDIISSIQTDVPEIKVLRLGKKIQGRPRPLRVSLPAVHDVQKILKGKARYNGPVKIFQDQTLKQRKHFKELQLQLRSMRDAGETNKTIRYKNGIPKIVYINPGAFAKN